MVAHGQQWNRKWRYGNISQSPAATPNMCVFQRDSRTRSCPDWLDHDVIHRIRVT
jgi:hypothetical protein